MKPLNPQPQLNVQLPLMSKYRSSWWNGVSSKELQCRGRVKRQWPTLSKRSRTFDSIDWTKSEEWRRGWPFALILARNRMRTGGDLHLQPEGDVAEGAGKDSFISRLVSHCRGPGTDKASTGATEVLSGAACSIARHKWQPKVELTKNECRREGIISLLQLLRGSPELNEKFPVRTAALRFLWASLSLLPPFFDRVLKRVSPLTLLR